MERATDDPRRERLWRQKRRLGGTLAASSVMSINTTWFGGCWRFGSGRRFIDGISGVEKHIQRSTLARSERTPRLAAFGFFAFLIRTWIRLKPRFRVSSVIKNLS